MAAEYEEIMALISHLTPTALTQEAWEKSGLILADFAYSEANVITMVLYILANS